jgi:RNA polymerase-binding protein DksA
MPTIPPAVHDTKPAATKQNGKTAAAKAPVRAKAQAPKSAVAKPIVIPAPSKPISGKSSKTNSSKPLSALPPKAGGSKSATSERSEVQPGAPRFPNNSPVPQAPVPTEGKPKKNLAGLGTRDLEHFRELILAKRRELVGDMTSMEREALRSANGTNLSNLPLHMADMGTDNYEQEFTLGLVEKERGLLRELNRALAKIQDGTYGICEGTGKPINQPRLEAQPWARFSIEYARMMERGLVRR